MKNETYFLKLYILATLIIFACFGWTLIIGEFFSDDFTWLWQGQKVGMSLSKALTYHMSSFFSPVPNLLYSFLYSYFGYLASVYFLFNIFVHITVSFLVGILLHKLTANKTATVIGVALAAVAGTAYEPLVWVGSNVHSLTTLFILVAVLCYYSLLQSGRSFWALGCYIAILLALGTKEVSVVIPGLLVLIFFLKFFRREGVPKNRTHFLLALIVFVTFALYIMYQYIWQHNAWTVTSGVWQWRLTSFIRLPIIILDMAIPLSPILNDFTAWGIWVTAILIVSIFIVFFWRHSSIMFGLGWTIMTVLPTMFMTVDNWWRPLASRYTYLPRIGIIIIIASAYSITRSVRVKYASFTFITLLLLWQTVYWVNVVRSEYGYVYKSGSSLLQTARLISEHHISRVLVAPNRPFEGNPAHIVGALEIIANIKEKNIVFLDEKIAPAINDDEVLMTWDPQQRIYILRSKQGIVIP